MCLGLRGHTQLLGCQAGEILNEVFSLGTHISSARLQAPLSCLSHPCLSHQLSESSLCAAPWPHHPAVHSQERG
jgi:hypothetical protein